MSGVAAARAGAGSHVESGQGLTLAVGSLVAYGGYGIGKVSLRRRDGAGAARREVVVVEFDRGLSVTLPIDRAAECLRPVSGKAGVASVKSVLRAVETSEDASWQRRTRASRLKIAEGGAVGLAEVVRNLARRDGRETPAAGKGRLSAYEHELYVEARRLLAAEVGVSLGVDPEAADAWIGEQLTHHADRALALAT